MTDNQELNISNIAEEFINKIETILEDKIEDIIEEALQNQIDSAVACAVNEALSEALNEGLSDFEFVLTDGTIVKPKQYMKLLSSDKSKLVLCYGGLRVDGSTLMVQTRISSWDSIGYYQNREDAIEALLKVKNAMDAGETIFEL